MGGFLFGFCFGFFFSLLLVKIFMILEKKDDAGK